MLDRNAPSPLHHQVRQYVLDRIQSGEWPVGSQIPPEQNLAKTLGVSRATVVRALADLVQHGVLERRQGRGTFVTSPRLLHGPFELKSFTEEHGDRGLATRAEILEFVQEPASPSAAQVLRLSPGEPIYRLRRLRYAGSETMGIQESHLPVRLFPSLEAHRERLTGSLYQVLEGIYGVRLERAVETFEPALLSRAQADLLRCGPMRLAFLVERTTYDSLGRAVEYVRSHMRGDRYKYSLELRRK